MESRPDPRPRTRTTGVLPLRPQVLARGGVIDWPASSSKTTQPPFAAAVLLPAATPLVSTTPPRRRHARSHAGSAAARTSHSAAAVATCPPRCTRRGTACRSPSSRGPASTAGRPTRVPADCAPTPSPTWLSARQIVGVDRVIPWRPLRRGRPRATGVANAPPTVPNPAAWQRSPGSFRQPRSTSRAGAGPAPARLSRGRSSRRPADISPSEDYRGHLHAVWRTARHHPIKFSS
ncbi:hypothetical protein JOC24_002694 [Streptomyces sp. HB132]|nr:hypothetical protein [Streptomyces sp. HB132]